MSNMNMIKMIFNDVNISKDEKYMLLIFKLSNEESENNITINLKTLMEHFESKRKKKVLEILKSLEDKGYIEIFKNKGKVNTYKLIRDYLINRECTEDNLPEINCDSYDLNTSSMKNNIISSNRSDTGDKNGAIGSAKNGTTSSSINDISYENGITGSAKNSTTSGSRNDTSYKNSTTDGVKNNTTSCVINDTSNENNTATSIIYDTSISNINTNSNINNKLNNIYINILNTWNQCNINNENVVNNEIAKAIYAAVKTYNISSVVNAIKNYSMVYKSQHYYNYRWSLISFLTKCNGLKRFLDDGDMWLDYKSKYYSSSDKVRELAIDIEDYID